MQNLLFTLCYFAVLVLPGAALGKVLARNSLSSPLSWIALSYSFFVLLFVGSNYWGLSKTLFEWILFVSVLSSFFILLVYRFAFKNLGREPNVHSHWYFPTFIIVGLSLGYQFMVGAFSEVPADLYSHLERFQFATKNLENDSLGAQLSLSQLLQQRSGVFYYLVAVISDGSSLSTRSILQCIDFANRTLFLLCLFFFTKAIFKHTEKSDLIAYAAVTFTSLHMGIGVFSYIRYYSFAPTMLAMVLYFFAISVFIEHIKARFTLRTSLRNCILILVASLAAAAVHTQEAMFIGIMILSISIVSTVLNFKSSHSTSTSLQWQTNLISFGGILAFTALYIYSSENFTRAPNAHWRLWEFGEGFWFFPQLTTLNLSFQFSQVITLWGLIVYGLFFCHFKRYRDNPYLVAGMLSPALTVLNPFFIDTFLRHYNSTTIWRLCYLIPIYFVAADLFVHYFRSMRLPSARTKIVSAVILVTLIALLLPIENSWRGVHYSRLPTLSASNNELSYVHYDDLIDFLEDLEQRESILTDPMLGYMLSGLTKHHSKRRKFFRDYRFKRFSFYNYDDNPLDKYKGYLLIINRRPSAESQVGKISRHWRENEWTDTHHYYPDELLDHLEKRPKKFEKLWERNNVSVYRIASSAS